MTSAKDKKLMSSLQGELAQAIVSDHKEWEESLTTTFSSMAFHALSEEYAAKMAEHILHACFDRWGDARSAGLNKTHKLDADENAGIPHSPLAGKGNGQPRRIIDRVHDSADDSEPRVNTPQTHGIKRKSSGNVQKGGTPGKQQKK
ncbi:hypothetical protein RB213_004609 [Colletotrichum asianum]|uniref:Uncharacterized protein n=1 Tax=Colletotrichum asianum TaxID=702518 RepID=A0A8H3ZKC2_9PEZI|nr:hypothetical protein GQ607_017868 [Colletotrichum asianum]